MKPVLGETQEHWASQILGTGYRQFNSPSGIGGLAKEKEDGNRLDILAVHSETPRAGQFRQFIGQCKEQYKTICVWVVDNITLRAALIRYGFTEETEVQPDGEYVNGFRWDKP